MSLPSFRRDGRRALVTGASSGLGQHFAETLARAGAEVVLAARRTDRIQAEVERLQAAGLKAHCVAMDVTSAASVREALAAAEKILLDDYIFAPAAIFPTRHLIKPTVHGWETSVAGYNNSQFLTLD